MYNPSEFSVGISRGKFWLRILLVVIITGIGGLRLYEGMQEQNNPRMLFGVAFIALGIFTFLQVWRYRVVITDAYIEQQDIFTTKRLMFTEILQAKERKRVLNLIGPTQTVRVQPDIDRADEVRAKINAKLNALPVLRLQGNTSYWGVADRDDEGRLVKR